MCKILHSVSSSISHPDMVSSSMQLPPVNYSKTKVLCGTKPDSVFCVHFVYLNPGNDNNSEEVSNEDAATYSYQSFSLEVAALPLLVVPLYDQELQLGGPKAGSVSVHLLVFVFTSCYRPLYLFLQSMSHLDYCTLI